MPSSVIGALRVSLALDSANFEAGTRRVRSEASKTASALQSAFGPLGSLLKGAVAGLAASVTIGGLISLAKGGLEFAASLGEVSQQIGVTARDLQVFRYIGQQNGVSIEEMDKGLQKFVTTLGKAGQGNKEAIAAFQNIGVSLKEVKTIDPHDALMRFADDMARTGDAATRHAREVALMGKAGAQLDPALALGSRALNELADAAERAGIVLSNEQIQQADRAADKLAAVRDVLKSRIAGFVADNAQAIYNLADAFATAANSALNFVNNMNKIGGLKDRTLGFIDRLTTLGGLKMKGTNFQFRNRVINDVAQLDFDPTRIHAPKVASVRQMGAAEKDAANKEAAAAAKQAAAEAKRAAREALQAEKDYQSRLGQARSQILGTQADLSASEREKLELSREQLEIERQDADATIALDEKLSGPRKAELTALNDKLYALRQDVLARNDTVRAARDALDISTSTIENQRDILQAQDGLATTASQRRDIELKLLDLQFQEERARLQAVTLVNGNNQTEVDIAQARLKMLGELQNAQAEGIRRQTAGPMESYLNSIPKTVDEIGEKLEELKVHQLQSLEDGFANITTQVLGVNGALGETLTLLLKIVAQQAILALQPGGGGFGGFLSGLGGVFGIGGGGVSAYGSSVISNMGSFPLPKFATGGRGIVGGTGPIDSKLISLRASPGELIDVRKGENDNGGRRMVLSVIPSPYFDVRVQEVATPIAHAAENRAVARSPGVTIDTINRSHGRAVSSLAGRR